jgi:hypothetical protein
MFIFVYACCTTIFEWEFLGLGFDRMNSKAKDEIIWKIISLCDESHRE